MIMSLKTLYISDLDGTLLNKNAEISEFTENTLNKLIQNGCYFSIATARTSATVLKMLSCIDFKLPVILMNGVSIYDIQNKKYIKTHIIEKLSVIKLFDTLKKHHITGFLYTIENNNLKTYYENINSDHAKQFIEERVKKYGKIFLQVDSFLSLQNNPVAYFSVCDKKENLTALYDELCLDENLHIEFYRDIYEQDFWYLEICSAKASKYNAVEFLREEYGFDKVVCFGDNLNDLPMFLASDECYAVENAKSEVKIKATAVINSNDNDGVAKWLIKNC